MKLYFGFVCFHWQQITWKMTKTSNNKNPKRVNDYRCRDVDTVTTSARAVVVRAPVLILWLELLGLGQPAFLTPQNVRRATSALSAYHSSVPHSSIVAGKDFSRINEPHCCAKWRAPPLPWTWAPKCRWSRFKIHTPPSPPAALSTRGASAY